MSFDVSRWDKSYFDVETAVLPCSTMIISQEIYDLLAGNTAGTVEYFADVKFGNSLTALEFVDMISVEREMGQIAGTLHVGFMTAASPISGMLEGAVITVESGMRFGGKTASQKVFHGKIKKITYPSSGESVRGYLDAFDAGKDLIGETPGLGYNTGPNAVNLPPAITGSVADWLASRLLTLGLSGVILRPKTAEITVPANTIIAYESLHECAKALVNAYDYRYLYIAGANELVILDPATLSAETPLFTLASPGITRKQQVNSLIDRANRVPYQKAGNTANASIYFVDSSGVLRQTAASAVTAIAGTYNDATDQASYPVLTADTLRNDIVTTAEEFEALAASYADETQRERHNIEIRFNPFIDLGNVIQIGSDKFFVSRLRHSIEAGRQFQTKIEVKKL